MCMSTSVSNRSSETARIGTRRRIACAGSCRARTSRCCARCPTRSSTSIYIDPPFNTGRTQRAQAAAHRARRRGGDRTGFAGRRYRTSVLGVSSFEDRFDDFPAFLEPRLARSAPRAEADGLAVRAPRPARVALREGAARRHLRPRLVHERDRLGLRLRRAHAQRAGPRSTTRSCGTRWIPRTTRSTTTRSTASRTWRPGLVGPEKAARGKTPTDVWWHTIVPTNGAREHRLRDPEAARDPVAHRRGALAARATWCSTSSPAAARPARRRRGSGAASSWSIRARRRSR